jgi:uncharacterized protein YeaO (DUF488 family)
MEFRMLLYTAQMAKHRKAKKLGLFFLDTTVKSGHPAFAPTWDMVLKFKRREIDWTEYTERYTEKMRESWRTDREAWKWLMSQDTLVLACYCNDLVNCHCHRYLLRDMVKAIGERYGIEVIDRGELQ